MSMPLVYYMLGCLRVFQLPAGRAVSYSVGPTLSIAERRFVQDPSRSNTIVGDQAIDIIFLLGFWLGHHVVLTVFLFFRAVLAILELFLLGQSLLHAER